MACIAHIIEIAPRHFDASCTACGKRYRLAFPDEAQYVHDKNLFSDEGPLIAGNNLVVIPRDYVMEAK